MPCYKYGKPYDPALRNTEHGSNLYNIWLRFRRQPHCDDWDYFPTFYEWAMQNNYDNGEWLRLIDKTGIYCPDNCVWMIPNGAEFSLSSEWIDGWNKTVNRIRKHYDMPPLEGTNYGDY